MGLSSKFALLYCIFLAFSVHAQQPQRPQKMSFSYVEHPVMVNVLIPLIREAYQSLGIETDFIAQPSNRNLRLVEKNILDGDVGYMRIVLADYHNLISLEPPLVLGIFTLLCRAEVECNAAVLADRTQTIVATSVTQHGMRRGYPGKLQSQFYTVNDLSLIPQFLSLGRFDYATYPTIASELWRIQTDELQFVTLFDANLYHVVHKKYAFMAADISQALQQVIDKKQQQRP